ncbi:MAG: hypothetical protein U0228_23320 [Myxococcaceae bacterium]
MWSLLVVALHAAPCLPSPTVRLELAQGTTLEVAAPAVARALCREVVIGEGVDRKAKVTVGLQGVTRASSGAALLKDALETAGVVVREENGAWVLHPLSPCDVAARALKAGADGEHRIGRADFALDWPSCAPQQARVVPAMEEGVVAGFKLFAIRPDSLWAAAGFYNGDVLLNVNGLPLTEPDHATQALAALRTTDRLDFLVRRRGVDLHLVVVVQP